MSIQSASTIIDLPISAYNFVNFHFMCFEALLLQKKVEVLVTQSCLTLCNPIDCCLSGSSVFGIFQARILEWVVYRWSFWTRDQSQVSCTAGRFFTIWATKEALCYYWHTYLRFVYLVDELTPLSLKLIFLKIVLV